MFSKKIKFSTKAISTLIVAGLLTILQLFLINQYANANKISEFQKKIGCQQSSGVWQRFNNSCADFCFAKTQKPYAVCLAAMSYSCQCSEDKCFNGSSCVDIPTKK